MSFSPLAVEQKSMTINPYKPLNRTIRIILENAKRNDEKLKKMGFDTYYFTFYSPVPKEFYRDYNVYVQPEREIYIKEIKNKAEKNLYRSLDEFMENIRRIAENARLYHTQGEKKVTRIPELAQGLVEYMQQKVDKAIQEDPKLENHRNPLAVAFLRLDALSKKVTNDVKGSTSLRNIIEETFGDLFESVIICRDDKNDTSLLADIAWRWSPTSICGSFDVVFHHVYDREPGQVVVAEIQSVKFDGGQCEPIESIPVTDLIENMEVLDGTKWWCESFSQLPLNDDDKRLLNDMRELVKNPEFRKSLQDTRHVCA